LRSSAGITAAAITAAAAAIIITTIITTITTTTTAAANHHRHRPITTTTTATTAATSITTAFRPSFPPLPAFGVSQWAGMWILIKPKACRRWWQPKTTPGHIPPRRLVSGVVC
jgi:hypothetical protein